MIYMKELFSLIDSPIPIITIVRYTLAYLLRKAYVLDKNDNAKEKGCLRRREKLSDPFNIESSFDISRKLYSSSYFSSVIIHYNPSVYLSMLYM